MRNRRRYLAKQLLKQIPAPAKRHPEKLGRAAAFVLSLWGFAGMGLPASAIAASPLASFQHQILEGFNVSYFSSPALADIDGDGDLDVFVGDRLGRISFYRNTGTPTSPQFTPDSITNPLAGFDVGYNATPALADIDGDGDLDALVGTSTGSVKFYRNNGTTLAPAFAPVAIGNPLAGVAVGSYATPVLADIDGDGDLDALIGEGGGRIRFYRNIGSSGVPVFAPVTAGNPLNLVATGYKSQLALVDIDFDGDLDAFIGNAAGAMRFYRNVGSAIAPVFALDTVTNPLASSKAGPDAAPAFGDVDGDGDLDALIGNLTGTLQFYRNTGSISFPIFTPLATGNPLTITPGNTHATPAFADIDNDGDLDAFIGSYSGTVQFYRNYGTAQASLFAALPAANPLKAVTTGKYTAPAFADIDGDGDLDALIGERLGTLKFYRNNGTAALPTMNADITNNPLAGFDVGYRATPVFADIDGDGDFDLFVGNQLGRVQFFRNMGTATAPLFQPDNAGNPLSAIDVGYNAAPALIDIDGDGDLDAFIGDRFGAVKFYLNIGTATAPAFAATPAANALAGFDGGYNTAPAFADIDGDGDADAFLGNRNGSILFIANKGLQSITLPGATGRLSVGTLTAGASIPTASLAAAPLVNPPTGTFPFGKISYNVKTAAIGGTATVRLTFPSAPPAQFKLYKVDFNNNYSVIPTTQYTVVNATTIDMNLTDGGRYDLDATANGTILDPITVGSTPPLAAFTNTTSGGCTIAPASRFDPSLLLMGLFSLFYLLRRKLHAGTR